MAFTLALNSNGSAMSNPTPSLPKIDIKLATRGNIRVLLFDPKEVPDYETYRRLKPKPVAETGERNLIVSGGITLLGQEVLWAMIQNYNAGWGSPFSSVTNLGDVYGALGTGNAAPSSTQTALSAEIGRVIVTNGAFSGTQLVYDFFFGTSQAIGTLVEAGIFLQASSTSGSGTMLNRSVFLPVIKPMPQPPPGNPGFTALLEVTLSMISG